mmetsp:Transcript_42260/g.108816  ORF Transcript_42260/g.108816 Transcript_42260/m.108816 type:complete len:387 (-) Transcript_42260:422-1582(-)
MFVSIIAGMDRLRFDVRCYSLQGASSKEELRKDSYRLAFDAVCTRLVDLRNKSDRQKRDVMNAAEHHVVLDLDGYLPGGQPHLLSPRIAPVQATMIGFPATTGVPSVDFIVSDRISSPPEYSRDGRDSLYTERYLYLPHTFYMNDLLRVHPRAVERTLPPVKSGVSTMIEDSAYLFCAFHQNFKLTAAIITAWSKILKACPTSRLWLLEPKGRMESEVFGMMQKNGVDAKQLIWTRKMPLEEHVFAKARCDLFLDTPVFSAHTTALDVALSRTPILSLPGSTMASRISTAILMEALPSSAFVKSSVDEYVSTAVGFCAAAKREGGRQQEKQRIAVEVGNRIVADSSPFRTDERIEEFEHVISMAVEATLVSAEGALSARAHHFVAV